MPDNVLKKRIRDEVYKINLIDTHEHKVEECYIDEKLAIELARTILFDVPKKALL